VRRSRAIVLASVVTLIVVVSIGLVAFTSSSNPLSAKLLSGSQVPLAWQSADYSKAVSGFGCLSKVLNPSAFHPTAEADVLYINHRTLPPEVGESIDTYRTTATTFQSVVASLDHCKRINGGENTSGISGSVTTLNFPRFGSSSAAFIASISDEAVPVTVTQDIVIVEKGRYVLEIFETNLGKVNQKQFEKFISNSLAKI
jgi:hypothetical protein